MIPWTHVMIHHSATRQAGTLQYPAIRRFHVEERDWHDVGYHRLVELVEDLPVVVLGRDLHTVGAHCLGWNDRAIGWCFVGDFHSGEAEPSQVALLAAARHMAAEMDLFKIPTKNILAHRDVSATACPGRNFPLPLLRRLVDGFRGYRRSTLPVPNFSADHMAEEFERWWEIASDRDFATEVNDDHRKAIAATSWDAALETSGVAEAPSSFAQAIERKGES